MPASITMTNQQHVGAGISLLDADGQPFASKPDNVSISFESSDPAVALFTPDESGMNGDITSGLVGSSIITVRVGLPDGSELSDTLAVAIVNSEPGSLNFTVGTPADEA